MDLYRSSKEIALIAFLYENNVDVETAHLFNATIKRLKDFERDLMEEPRKSLKNVGFPLGKVIDLVGKLVKPEALEIFVGKMERSQAKSFLGLRDQKIMSVDLIRITLESDLEARAMSKSKVGDNLNSNRGGDILVNTLTNNFVLKTGNDDMRGRDDDEFGLDDDMGSIGQTGHGRDLILNGDNFALGDRRLHGSQERTRKSPQRVTFYSKNS